METKIFKYQFDTSDSLSISMPKNAEILCVQMQDGWPCIWAKVNPLESTTLRNFEVYETGHPIQEDKNRKYIGTYQQSSGLFVFHLFEVIY